MTFFKKSLYERLCNQTRSEVGSPKEIGFFDDKLLSHPDRPDEFGLTFVLLLVLT